MHIAAVDLEETGEVVERDEKGRGYEVTKGKYAEIEPEDQNSSSCSPGDGAC